MLLPGGEAAPVGLMKLNTGRKTPFPKVPPPPPRSPPDPRYRATGTLRPSDVSHMFTGYKRFPDSAQGASKGPSSAEEPDLAPAAAATPSLEPNVTPPVQSMCSQGQQLPGGSLFLA